MLQGRSSVGVVAAAKGAPVGSATQLARSRLDARPWAQEHRTASSFSAVAPVAVSLSSLPEVVEQLHALRTDALPATASACGIRPLH